MTSSRRCSTGSRASSRRSSTREPDVLVPVIAESCRIKAEVVSRGRARVAGCAAILNFGHTVGHALEAVTDTGASATAKRSPTACWPPRISPSRAARSPSAIATRSRTLDREPRSAAAGRRPVGDASHRGHAARQEGRGRHAALRAATGIGATTIVDDVTEDELTQQALRAIGFRSSARRASIRSRVLHLRQQRLVADLQQRRRRGLVAAGLLQRRAILRRSASATHAARRVGERAGRDRSAPTDRPAASRGAAPRTTD